MGVTPEPINYGVCIDGGVLVTAGNCRDWIRADPTEPGAPIALAFLNARPHLNGEATCEDPNEAVVLATALKRAYGDDGLVTIVLWPRTA